jgi:pyruvate ferredoxin oxidoreductase alpha subunit
MWEMCYIASGTRMPIVMTLVNRALSGPLNIHCDHSDSMGARDSGWIQLFCENAQEAYDNLLQANRIAEHKDVLLPVMVNYDGFIISHGVENVTVYEDDKVKTFVGEYKPENYLLNKQKPITFGPILLTDYYFESKRQHAEAARKSYKVISGVADDFAKTFGPKYDFTHGYKLEDAEIVVVGLGSAMGTARVMVDNLREKGIKAGLLKIRLFRPFPEEEIAQKLSKAKAVAILDRADSYDGRGGPLCNDIKASLFGKLNIPLANYIYGLGGRDIGFTEIETVFEQLKEISKTGKALKEPVYLGVRE